MSEKLAYTIKEAVAVSPLSRSTLYEDIAAGKLPARKRGGRTFIMRADLEDYLKAMPVVGGRN